MAATGSTSVRFCLEDGDKVSASQSRSGRGLRVSSISPSFSSRCSDPGRLPQPRASLPGTTAVECDKAPRSWRQRLQHATLLVRTSVTTFGTSTRSHPSTVIVPLVVFVVLVVAGEVGVWAASRSYSNQLHSSTQSVAKAAAQQLEQRIQTAISPLVSVDAAVQAQPYAPTLAANFPQLAEGILKRADPSGYVARLQLVPWGVVSGTYPVNRVNLATMRANLFGDPVRARDAMMLASFGPLHIEILAPATLLDGSTGISALTNVYTTQGNESLAPGVLGTFTVPYAPNVTLGNITRANMTLCGAACNPWVINNVTYNFWGFVLSSMRLTAFLPPLEALEMNNPNYWYIMGRKSNPTLTLDPGIYAQYASRLNYTSIIAMSNVSIETFLQNQRECTDIVLNGTLSVRWQLCIVPQDGWQAPYKLALMIVVPIVALIIAVLLCAWMAVNARLREILSHMLPLRVIGKLAMGQRYAEPYRSITILFADIVSYTDMASSVHPDTLVSLLDTIYSAFDRLTSMHGVYKVETIGDAFVVVGGAPDPCDPRDAAQRMARLAVDMIEMVRNYTHTDGRKVEIRVGINSGDVTAAVIGKTMPHWTLVGDAMNVAARMQANSKAMHVHVSQSTADLLAECLEEFYLEPRGQIDVKGKGKMATYFLSMAATHGTPEREKEGEGADDEPQGRKQLVLDKQQQEQEQTAREPTIGIVVAAS